jgi:DNA-binding MurR/RpiR family transcriptional regulator
MDPKANILERIALNFTQLPPTARDIANYVQQNPMALLTMSVSELADACQSSKATVSRFFRQLGYDSHKQAKQALLQSRNEGFPLVSAVVSDRGHLENEIQNIQQSFQDLSSEYTSNLGSTIANASRVFVIGFRNAYPLALHFRQQLMQIRSNVVLLPHPGQTLGEDLVDLDAKDIVVIFGFRRRPANFEQLINALSAQQTLLITDPTGQIFNHKVKHTIVCSVGGKEAFDSYAAPMSLVSLLCSKTYQAMSSSGTKRSANISAWYSQANEISKL